MKILKSVLIIIGLTLVAFVVYYGPVYTYRVLVWQNSDYDDFKRYATVPIKKGGNVFTFYPGTEDQMQRVKSDFESHALISNLEEFHKQQSSYAFIVIRNDTILYENYFLNNHRNSVQTSFSTAKSVLSLLVGIAIQEQKIMSVNDPITDYLPELLERDERFAKIRIEDLLRMKSGIKFERGVKFPFVTSDEPLTYSHPDLRWVALNKTKIVDEPNTQFLYNDYNALLTGLILERATGESVSSYLESRIWKKSGMEYDASWISDENEFEQMQSGLNARSIDFAKIGRLVLNDGYFRNESVVDSSWIAQSTMPRDTLIFRSGQQWAYSYMWWSVVRPELEREIFACGHMGQFMYVSPASNTIIIRHGLEEGDLDDDDWTEIFSHFTNQYVD